MGDSPADLFENNIFILPLAFPAEPVVKEEIKFLISKMLEIRQSERFDFNQVRDYLALLDQDLNYYCKYLINMARFYQGLNNDMSNAFEIEIDAQLAILLRKYEMMCYYKLDEVARTEEGLEIFEKSKEKYQKKFRKAKKLFKEEVLQKFEQRRGEFPDSFNKLILNENYKISSDFKVEYARVFSQALSNIQKAHQNSLEALDKEKLNLIAKLIEIRSMSNLENNFAFDDETFYVNPFSDLNEKIEIMKRAKLIGFINNEFMKK